MIKLGIKAPLSTVYDLIDKRLTLVMAEKKIINRNISNLIILEKTLKFTKKCVSTIDGTIFYLTKDTDSAELLFTAAGMSSSGPELVVYGAKLISTGESSSDLYIDTRAEAYEKGIISDSTKMKSTTKAILLSVLLLCFLISFTTGMIIFFIIAFPVMYPIYYIKGKRKFQRSQKIMNTIVDIFESEFGASTRFDSKDWVNFWGQVKSDVKGFASDMVP